MTVTLQIMQVVLFAIPILTMLGIGLLILLRPVSIIDRRMFLVVFIPLLLANTLMILVGDDLQLDWRAWLVLGANVVLIAGAIYLARGALVYGLTPEAVEQIFADMLRKKGFEVETRRLEKQDLWGRTRDACLVNAEKDTESHQFWITARFNEVLIRAEQRASRAALQVVIPALLQVVVPYDFKKRATGVLYIVLAVVFAILVWILFFEPRFILID
jgi:hypothetical protein